MHKEVIDTVVALFLSLTILVLQAMKMISVADFQLDYISLKIFLAKVSFYYKLIIAFESIDLIFLIFKSKVTFLIPTIALFVLLVIDLYAHYKYSKRHPDYATYRISLSKIKRFGIAKLVFCLVLTAYYLVSVVKII